MMHKIRLFISTYWIKISFFILGLGSLIWFLIRVIPKPSRAQYPCMKAAAPVASSFISYLLGISVFAYVFKKARQRFLQSKFIAAGFFILIGLVAGTWAIVHTDSSAKAHALSTPQPVNQPIGEGKGVFPGRVVWAHNTAATNADVTNKTGDYWFMDKNTNPVVVKNMLSSAIQQLTGTTTDAAAWDLIFRNYNKTHGRGDVGYTAGEKIVIKINLNGLAGGYPKERNINTSPQLCIAVLDQLINVAHVAQSDIGIGDPSHDIDNTNYTTFHNAFPDVEYWGSGKGKTVLQPTSAPVLIASDGSYEDVLPQKYVDATYMINIPVFKKHHRAGISLCCKNHFGTMSAYTGGAWHLHPSLPCPNATGTDDNGEYGVYRCFVDIMGHADLGGKTVLYLIDGLWGSINWGHPAIKWAMPPFNDDFPNSLFVSIDPVAIESVCFDFLYYEFDENHPTEGIFVGDDKGPFPHFAGVDDYLHQGASPDNWPAGIKYDPENDGTILKSMGTHEHWNNAIDKKYSRDLSPDGKGIELIKDELVSVRSMKEIEKSYSCSNYPNPFKGSTTIQFKLEYPSNVKMLIYDLKGQRVGFVNFNKLDAGDHQYNWDGKNSNGQTIPSGTYIYKLEIENKAGIFRPSNKMSVIE
jgi:hypothetical protein